MRNINCIIDDLNDGERIGNEEVRALCNRLIKLNDVVHGSFCMIQPYYFDKLTSILNGED